MIKRFEIGIGGNSKKGSKLARENRPKFLSPQIKRSKIGSGYFDRVEEVSTGKTIPKNGSHWMREGRCIDFAKFECEVVVIIAGLVT